MQSNIINMFWLVYFPKAWELRPQVIVVEEKCNGCSLCVKLCPGEVFELVNGKARVVREENCVLCYGCVVLCDPKAIIVRDLDP